MQMVLQCLYLNRENFVNFINLGKDNHSHNRALLITPVQILFCHFRFIVGNRHACSLHLVNHVNRVNPVNPDSNSFFLTTFGRICKFAPTLNHFIFFRVHSRNPWYPRSIFYLLNLRFVLFHRARASCPYRFKIKFISSIMQILIPTFFLTTLGNS